MDVSTIFGPKVSTFNIARIYICMESLFQIVLEIKNIDFTGVCGQEVFLETAIIDSMPIGGDCLYVL